MRSSPSHLHVEHLPINNELRDLAVLCPSKSPGPGGEVNQGVEPRQSKSRKSAEQITITFSDLISLRVASINLKSIARHFVDIPAHSFSSSIGAQAHCIPNTLL